MILMRALPLTILFILLCAIPALALVPGLDPTQPSKYVDKRAQYRGSRDAVPAPSSSGQRISASSRLGEEFPKTIYTPTFSGRVVGPARFEPRQAVFAPRATPTPPRGTREDRRTSTQERSPYPKPRVSSVRSISGNNKVFPKTLFTPTYEGRWTGIAKNP